jgi:hypothetical protein
MDAAGAGSAASPVGKRQQRFANRRDRRIAGLVATLHQGQRACERRLERA